jgi:hypothetical protein
LPNLKVSLGFLEHLVEISYKSINCQEFEFGLLRLFYFLGLPTGFRFHGLGSVQILIWTSLLILSYSWKILYDLLDDFLLLDRLKYLISMAVCFVECPSK